MYSKSLLIILLFFIIGKAVLANVPFINYAATPTYGTGSGVTKVKAHSPALAADATLSSLTLSAGTIFPSFTSANTAYGSYEVNAVSSVMVTPLSTDPAATVKVNGTTVPHGSSSTAISLTVGNNLIAVTVIASDFSTNKTYYIIVQRAKAAPSISYATPQTYNTGKAITALSPTNTGGSVPVALYQQVVTFAGSGLQGSTNGTGTAASFKGLGGLGVDIAGNVYLAEYANDLIRKITRNAVVTTYAGSGTPGAVNANGTSAKFRQPIGTSVDPVGNVYVADGGNNLIRKINTNGDVTTFAGSGVDGTSDGTGTAATFSYPTGIAADLNGNVYVTDGNGANVRKITPAGVVTTFASGFDAPYGVTVDGFGNVFVSDFSNRIFKVTPGGSVSVLAGSGANGSANGTGTAASFNNPQGLTVDVVGNVYVADTDNQLIREISPAGVVTTFAGSGATGSASGIGTTASFNGPTGLAVDTAGNLYSSDGGSRIIRKLSALGYTVSPALPAGLSLDGTGTISGTPTVSSPSTNYTITAYNSTGNSSAIVNITVATPTALDKTGVSLAASSAYSLRQLKTAYTHAAITAPAAVSGFTNSTTPVVRVRRSTDNGQLDIGYTAGGDLDTITLKSFVGNANGYVSVWYDQSNNSYDVTQTNATLQPAIVVNGVVERSGVRPAIRFYTQAQTVLQAYIPAASMFGSGYIGSAFPVMEASGANVKSSAFGYGGNYDRWQVHAIQGANFDVGNPFNRIYVTNDAFTGVIRNYSLIADANLQQIYISGVLQASSTAALTPCTQSQFNIGGIPNFGCYHDNHESELIIYNTQLSTSDRQAMETNQVGYYAVFTAPTLTSFTPTSGSAGTSVTITGTNFNNATAVLFGGTAAASFTVNSNTSITAIVGSGSSGSVTVNTPSGPAGLSGFLYGNGLDKTGIIRPASSAYSLRQLKTTYTHGAIAAPTAVTGFTNSTTPLVRVRRTSDDGMLDIGYTANGDLDTATLKSFVGLNSGYVVTWYDQSSNSYDVTQANKSQQPAIVTSGVVERSGAMPAIRFYNQLQTVLQGTVPAASMFGSGYIGSVFPVMEASGANVKSSVFGYGSGSDRWQVHAIQGAVFDVGNPFNRIYITNDAFTGVLKNYSFIADANLQQIYINGALQASSTTSMTPCTQSTFNIGGIPDFFCYHDNHESELVIYNIQLSTADRQTLENNQFAYYNPNSPSPNSAFVVNMTPPAMTASASSVKLSFNASGGEGNSNYQVQKLGSSGFSSIANLSGTGTGDFTAADAEPLNGNNYYRIAATDSKGQLVYSSTVNLNVLTGGKGILVYPNPVTNSNMVLNFNLMNKGTYNLTLADALGNVVLKKSISYDGFTSSVNVQAPGTRLGVYMLKISSDSYQRTLRLIFQ